MLPHVLTTPRELHYTWTLLKMVFFKQSVNDLSVITSSIFSLCDFVVKGKNPEDAHVKKKISISPDNSGSPWTAN